MSENDALSFKTFHSSGWDYLIRVRDKPARLFGLRYLDFLQSHHRGVATGLSPKPATPVQRLVQVELERIYKSHYGKDVGAAA